VKAALTLVAMLVLAVPGVAFASGLVIDPLSALAQLRPAPSPGPARLIPYGIGIGKPLQGENTTVGPFVTSGGCFAWLHTHTNDGIIHIESPVQRTFTLGNFFDVWDQPLGPDQVGPAHGHVTVFVNHELYAGNPRNIPLLPQAQIQLDVGSPVIAPETIKFPPGL
jgi:hypothetical protein